MNSWRLSLHWSCLCWRCCHTYVWSAPSRQRPPINAYAAILCFPGEVSATDTWCMLVGSCLQCRGASVI